MSVTSDTSRSTVPEDVHRRSDASPGAVPDDLHRRPAADLVRDLSGQVSALARQELELARAELTAKGREIGLGAGLLGGSAVLALLGLGALTAAAILGLDTVMDGWLAAIVVGAAWLAIAGVLALIGRSRTQRGVPPMPEQAMQTTREDVRFTKQRIQEARR